MTLARSWAPITAVAVTVTSILVLIVLAVTGHWDPVVAGQLAASVPVLVTALVAVHQGGKTQDQVAATQVTVAATADQASVIQSAVAKTNAAIDNVGRYGPALGMTSADLAAMAKLHDAVIANTAAVTNGTPPAAAR